VHDRNKALWAALKDSAAEIKRLRADAVRVEARVDAQGQGHERTEMAVACIRVASEHGVNAGSSVKARGDVGGRGCSGGGSGGACSGGCGNGGCGRRNRDSGRGGSGSAKHVKPAVKLEDAPAAAMALAPVNEEKAAVLRRPIRALVKKIIAQTTLSCCVLMDADTQTAVINDEVVKAFAIPTDAAHSYLMSPVWFLSDDGKPKKKRPISKITSTIPHTVAQTREFLLKPFFNALGFQYNPMPLAKAEKWEKKDVFLTSYKGERALVAAAKDVFSKIGGGSRIVKDGRGSHRFHVDMLVGHHVLFASFVRNAFEIALGRRTRRRGGSGNGVYLHWVDVFAPSIKHLRKNHADKKVHAGYRITDAIDPNMVVPTGGGRWVFAAAGKEPAPLSLSADGDTPDATLKSAARPPHSTKTAGVTGCPEPGRVEAGVRSNAAGRDMDNAGSIVAPRATCAIVGDDDSDYRTGAALIGIVEEGAADDGEGSVGGGSIEGGGVGGQDVEEKSDDVGARTSSSDSDDSDSSADGSMEDEEGEGPY